MTASELLNFINNLPPEVWQTIVSAIFLSPIMVGVKKYLSVHHELLMTIYVIGGAIITAAISYVQNTPDFAPWLIIPLQGLVTFAVSQPVYYGIVKPLKNNWQAMVAQADAINEAKRAAALPADQSVTTFK